MRLRKAAAPLPASAKLAGALRSRNLGHHSPKEKHGEGEKKMASSPMQRRKAWAHGQALTMAAVKPRVFNPLSSVHVVRLRFKMEKETRGNTATPL
jgi:hypothetical protein